MIVGVTGPGHKELVAVEDGHRESEASWLELLQGLKSRGCGSRGTTLVMVFKLMETARTRWKRIKGFQLLELVVNNVEFRDGEAVEDPSDTNAA